MAFRKKRGFRLVDPARVHPGSIRWHQMFAQSLHSFEQILEKRQCPEHSQGEYARKKTCDAMQKSMPDSNLGTSLKLWTLQGFRYFVAQICFRKNGGTWTSNNRSHLKNNLILSPKWMVLTQHLDGFYEWCRSIHRSSPQVVCRI
jgi:hypothetical protein